MLCDNNFPAVSGFAFSDGTSFEGDDRTKTWREHPGGVTGGQAQVDVGIRLRLNGSLIYVKVPQSQSSLHAIEATSLFDVADAVGTSVSK